MEYLPAAKVWQGSLAGIWTFGALVHVGGAVAGRAWLADGGLDAGRVDPWLRVLGTAHEAR